MIVTEIDATSSFRFPIKLSCEGIYVVMHFKYRAVDWVVLKVISVLISALLYRVINQVRKVCALNTNAYVGQI